MRTLSISMIAVMGMAGVACAAAPFPFYAFCMDTHDSAQRTLPQQAQLLKELGYDGAGHLWLDKLNDRVSTLQAENLNLMQVYLRVNVKQGAELYEPRLKESLTALKGSDTVLAVIVSGLPSGDPAGRDRAVEALRAIADAAADNGLRVAIYPHVGDWVERVEQAMDLMAQVDRPNVGVMFNLCHWLKEDGNEANLEPLFKKAGDRLYGVSINGADCADDIRNRKGNWIQPLGQGTFDVGKFLKILWNAGYRGPVGLQCYGLKGDAKDHLAKSMQAWKSYMKQIEAEQ